MRELIQLHFHLLDVEMLHITIIATASITSIVSIMIIFAIGRIDVTVIAAVGVGLGEL